MRSCIIVALALLATVALAFAVTAGEPEPTEAGKLALGIKGVVSYPVNTNNDDEHELSSETVPGFSLFANREILPWLQVEGDLAYLYGRQHGHNKGVAEQSINGSTQVVALTIGPRLIVPRDWEWLARPYVTIAAGPSLTWRDTTRSSVTGEKDDCSGCLDIAVRGELGAEREVVEHLILRAGVNYTNVGASWNGDADFDGWGIGIGGSYRFDWW